MLQRMLGHSWAGALVSAASCREHAVIASRVLEFRDGGAVRKLTVRLRQPYRTKGIFACDYEITGFADPVRRAVHGEDSMQSLLLAITAVQRGLWPFRKKIAWLGDIGDDGFPYRMFFADPSNERMRKLFDLLVDRHDAEQARLYAERIDSRQPADVVKEVDELEHDREGPTTSSG